jgi:hypothetical protein
MAKAEKAESFLRRYDKSLEGMTLSRESMIKAEKVGEIM